MEMFSDGNLERSKDQPAIRLEVFRHDEKDVAEQDIVAPLTAKGKINAVAKGKSKNPQLNRGYVIASPRDRALHSALLQFFGSSLPDLENSTLHDLIGQIENYEQKVKTDERLNFHVESHPEFSARFYGEYGKKEGNNTLGFQLDESDQLILDLATKADASDEELAKAIHELKGYKGMVGDMAEIILEYFDKLKTWEKDYKMSPNDFDKAELQIFVGTHSQNVECFLLRIMEMQNGANGLKDFLDKLPHRKSFIDYSEGFDLTIFENENGEIVAELNFRESRWMLTRENLLQLIEEKSRFDLEVAQQLKK